jgi:hypothetical protein
MTRRAYEVFIKLHNRFAVGSSERERGDVPGWVMITLMTAVIVVAIWGLASKQLSDLLTSAFSKVKTIGS